MKPAVFLDRDGVINKVVFRDGKLSVPFSSEELEFLPGVREAILELKKKGYWCLVVTNQPNAGKDFSFETLFLMHQRLKDELGVDVVYSCPHGDNSNCLWFKPRPGMIQEAAHSFDLDIGRSFVIGDRWRDIELAKNAGCRSVLIPSEATKFDNRVLAPDYTAANLLEAARLIISFDTA